MYVCNILFPLLFIFVYVPERSGYDMKSRAAEGYPNGFLAQCPETQKATIIRRNTLKHLSFVHVGEGNFMMSPKRNFNYFQMKDLAKKMDFNKKTVLYVNGYLDSARHFWSGSIMGSVYSSLGYNVLLLEYMWFTIMAFPNAIRFNHAVSNKTAEMLATLTNYGLNPKKLELVGLSLGGHGIGFIARQYRHLTGMNISRITGLDPSGPCMRHLGPEGRIDASDADFVDIVHTNIDAYGMATRMGHIDYYVNGGEFQINDIKEIACSSLCSHLKSYFLWLASVQYPDHFKAVKCDSIQDARDRNCYSSQPLVNLFGPKADRSKTGIFYLPTTYYYPYYMGHNGTKRENDPYHTIFENVNDVLTL